jgi:hypothetical protein
LPILKKGKIPHGIVIAKKEKKMKTKQQYKINTQSVPAK